MPISTDNYSERMFGLLNIYYQSGIWKKYNWYDFLEELRRIVLKMGK